MSICYIIYYVYPTQINRPIINNSNIFNFLVNIVYSADKPVNCFPSLHVLTTYFIMRYTKYKWMMWLVLLCFSCVNEEQRAVLSDEPGKVRMNMSISTRATYDPEVLNENETRINRLRLYVFDGSTLDKMYYWSDLNIILQKKLPN